MVRWRGTGLNKGDTLVYNSVWCPPNSVGWYSQLAFRIFTRIAHIVYRVNTSAYTYRVNHWSGGCQGACPLDTPDASLVILVTLGARKCCFTGDASDKSLSWIAENTINYYNDILHASNHGSLYGANLDFIKGTNAEYTIISTESGIYKEVPHPIAIKRYYEYTKVKVHRTDLDGTVEMFY